MTKSFTAVKTTWSISPGQSTPPARPHYAWQAQRTPGVIDMFYWHPSVTERSTLSVTWPHFNTTTATKKEIIQTELVYPLTIEMVIVLEECMNLSHNWPTFPMTLELNDDITMLLATEPLSKQTVLFCLLKVQSHLSLWNPVISIGISAIGNFAQAIITPCRFHTNSSHWPTDSRLVWKWLLCEQCVLLQ